MADAKFKAARLAAENAIYQMMDELEARKGGYNSSNIKAYLNTLSDAQFVAFMKRIRDEEWFTFDIDMDDKQHSPNLNRLKTVAKKYNIPLTEYVAYPFKNPKDPANPSISKNKVPVLYCIVRPLAQLLDKKSAYASGRDHVNLLQGTVTGKSKASTFTNVQSIALTTSNQLDTLKEMMGPRADDPESKAKMLKQIADTGKFDINSIPIRTQDKQSLETIRVFLISAGLRVAFGNNKLSYVLPLD